MSDMEPVTAILIPEASAALGEASELTGLSRTDVINRALQAYAYLERAASEGAAFTVSKGSGRRAVRKIVRFL